MTDSTSSSFFAEALRTGGPGRDGRKRPMLVPRGAPAGTRSAYRRASSFADLIDNKFGIHRWEMRLLARGLAENDDLRMLAAGEVYTSAKLAEDVGENRASGERLDKVISRALDRMGVHTLADRGTAIHSFFDLNNFNKVPEELKAAVAGYHQRRADDGIVAIANEQFVACDEVMAAGTYDSLDHHPNYGVVIGDGKTGDLGVGFVVQTSIYNHAEAYDTDTDERSPIHPELNQDVALLYDVKNEGTKIYAVDTAAGWEITKAIHKIKSELKMDLITIEAPLTKVSIVEMIRQSKTKDELIALHTRTSARWTPDDNAAATARLEELEAS